MTNYRWIFLNAICGILIIYFSILAWNSVLVSTPFFDNDFKTFEISLNNPIHNQTYVDHQYVRVLRVISQVGNTKKVSTSPPISAVNMNTPLMNGLLKLLIHLSPRLSTAITVWVVASLLSATIAILFLMHWFDDPHKKYRIIPILALVWLSWPSLYDLKLGQVSFFILPFVCGCFLLVTQKKWNALVFFLALLASLKLFFLIFILWFVVRREWNKAGLFMLYFLLLFFLPLLYYSWQSYVNFFHIAHNYVFFINRSILPMNGSLLGLVTNTALLLKLHPSLLSFRLSATILVIYFVVRWVLYDYHHTRLLPAFSNEVRFCYLILLALLCSPLAWVYYFLFLIVLVAVFLRVSQVYVLPTKFFVFFTAGITLPCLAWMGAGNYYLMVIAHFICFTSLLCWIVCLYLAEQAISANVINKGPRQNHIIIGVCVIYAAINVILLAFNYGMPYFLYLNQKDYLKKVAPAMWIQKSRQ